jgi:hypothetical protein
MIGVVGAVLALLVFGSVRGSTHLPPAPSTRALSADSVTVFKSPTCGCCADWVDHMRENGFAVRVRDTSDVTVVKNALGVPQPLRSCHTAQIGRYVFEGHVPADLIQRLLAERPAVHGLAVPGMPSGSPGMENGRKDAYQVLTFDARGQTTVYAER